MSGASCTKGLVTRSREKAFVNILGETFHSPPPQPTQEGKEQKIVNSRQVLQIGQIANHQDFTKMVSCLLLREGVNAETGGGGGRGEGGGGGGGGFQSFPKVFQRLFAAPTRSFVLCGRKGAELKLGPLPSIHPSSQVNGLDELN